MATARCACSAQLGVVVAGRLLVAGATGCSSPGGTDTTAAQDETADGQAGDSSRDRQGHGERPAGAGQWQTFTSDDGLGADAVAAVAGGGAGVVWAGTRGGGLSRFDGSEWTTYRTENGLRANDHPLTNVVRSVAVAEDATGGPCGASRFDGHE